MGEVIEIFVVMLIIAACAFAPLGYFIKRFSENSDQPLGDIEPHGDSESWLMSALDKLVNAVKGAASKS